MMENAYPYLTKNHTNETELEALSNSNPQTYFTIHNPQGNDKMNNSTTVSNSGASTPSTTATTMTGFNHGVPVGTYTAKVVSASRKIHPEQNHDIVRVNMEITEPNHKGHPLSKYYNHRSKESVIFFKREMGSLGFKVGARDELDDLCTSLVGTDLLAQVADLPSGNQVILLKSIQSPKKTPVVDPDSLWV